MRMNIVGWMKKLDAILDKCLSAINFDSDEFISNREVDENYAAINEAIRRLRNDN